MNKIQLIEIIKINTTMLSNAKKSIGYKFFYSLEVFSKNVLWITQRRPNGQFQVELISKNKKGIKVSKIIEEPIVLEIPHSTIFRITIIEKEEKQTSILFNEDNQ